MTSRFLRGMRAIWLLLTPLTASSADATPGTVLQLPLPVSSPSSLRVSGLSHVYKIPTQSCDIPCRSPLEPPSKGTAQVRPSLPHAPSFTVSQPRAAAPGRSTGVEQMSQSLGEAAAPDFAECLRGREIFQRSHRHAIAFLQFPIVFSHPQPPQIRRVLAVFYLK